LARARAYREDLDALIAGAPDYQPQASEQGPQESGPVDDAVEIEKLARMPALDYERTRKAAAERLGIKRLSLLDGLVKAKRAELGLDGGDGLQGRAIEFPEPEPWPQPVDGGALLDGIAKAIRAHVVMSDTGRDACALWVVHSYLTEHFLVSPRLGVRSPTKGCGKTLLLDVLGCLVRRPLPTASVTPAAIFRVIESHDPTLLIDEADTFLRDNEELRGMLNSGHRRGAGVLRIVGEEHAPRAFATYGACAIALIGALPDTLHDRAITIDLKRRLASEKVEPFRPDRAENLEVLARQAARWTADNAERVAAIDPEMPANIINREGDNWRPLIAIADAAAGTWPQRARQAAQAAHNAGASDDALVELLLGDIRDIFGKGEDMVPEIASADLVKSLVDIEGHPWAEMGRSRKALTQHGLARLLKPLGIPTQKIGPADDRVSGYVRAHFEEAFRRYLGPDGVSDSDTRTECDEIRTSEIFDSDSPDPSCPSRKCEKSNNDGILSDCPSRKGGERPNAHDVRFRAMRRARLERRGAMRLLRTSRGQLGGVRRRRLHAPASRLRTAPGSRAAWPKKGYGVLERSPPKRKAALRRARQRQREPSRHALRNRAHRQRVKAGRIVVPVEIGLGELEWLVSVRWITPAEADAGDARTIGAAIAAGLAASVKGRIGALRRSPNTSVGKRITPLRKHHLFFFPTQPHNAPVYSRVLLSSTLPGPSRIPWRPTMPGSSD
jgi:hypothetical protein